ncbi:hypothetical protein [Brevundimonas sp. Root1423]|uniref:hypothetical protein n=1 Tax=Brevundimonas sp. Root1423 TaxID=1736462 RepID=UPI000700A279|nr:hypothetical protein [Brevundimonas sp. Root1423]KQY96403.1 hypothetical protein ASD25_00495 [Brevundimonas sp. Root1423]
MADRVLRVIDNQVRVSVAGGPLVAALAAQAALPFAERAEAALAEIEDLASGAPDAPSILNKLNLNGSNVAGNAAALRTAIGADLPSSIILSSEETLLERIDTGPIDLLGYIPRSIRNNIVTGASTPIVTSYVHDAVADAIASGRGLYWPTTISPIRIDEEINVTGPLSVFGDGRERSKLICDGCNGFVVAAGVDFVDVRDMSIAHITRYATTPNAFAAIRVNGTSSGLSYWSAFQGLLIDGFERAFDLAWVSNCYIADVKAPFVHKFIRGTGTGVNNWAIGNWAEAQSESGSVGLHMGDGLYAIEGWNFISNLVSQFETGGQFTGAANMIVSSNIIDFFVLDGIVTESSAGHGTTCMTVTDNYIACNGLAGNSGVRLSNDTAAAAGQDRGNTISGNQILAYTGKLLTYGIRQEGAEEHNNRIVGNAVTASNDCRLITGTDTIVANNHWLQGGFSTLVDVAYTNNIGDVVAGSDLLYSLSGTRRTLHKTSAPASGTYARGDVCWSPTPSAGGSPGWVCVAAGSPGTWKAMPALAA